MKNFSKIIREFDRLPYKIYERRRPKHDPTDSYFYFARQLEKFMMRADALNLENHPVIMEITGAKHIPILHVCYMDSSESKELLVEKTLSQVCPTDEDEKKHCR